MPDWDDVDKIVKAEASDIADGLRAARDRLDAELTRKERELAATPQERMDMILADIDDHHAATEALLDETPSATTDPEGSAKNTADPEGSAKNTAAEGSAKDTALEGSANKDTAAEGSAKAAGTADAASDADRASRPSTTKPAARPASQLQIEYEQRKAQADDLLDELRGELGIADS